MPQVSALEFSRQLGAMQDAAQSEPVEITKHGRKYAVLVSATLFAALMARARRSFRTEEMPDDLLAAVKAAHMNPKYNYLNGLLEPERKKSPLQKPRKAIAGRKQRRKKVAA